MISGLELIPQRDPMKLIDFLVTYNDGEAVTEFTVPAEGVFIEDGALAETGILENMAQSCAARIGYIAKYINHTPVRIGYIGAVKNFTVLRRPRSGEKLTTTVHPLQDIFNITLSEVSIRCGEETIATATLKTAVADDPAEESL